MKPFLLILLFLTSQHSFAAKNILHSIYLADRPTYDDGELSMTGEFGFLVTGGNTNTSSVTARMNTSQELQAWSYQLIGDMLYKQTEAEIDGKRKEQATAQKLFISSQLDYKLHNPKDRMFIYGEYENNRFNNFKYQAAVAAGWSSRLWSDKTSEFRYSVGPGYARKEVEKNTTTEGQSGIIVRAAMEYKRKFSEQATFRQFLSTEADSVFAKTKSESSLSTRITGALAMKLSLILNHDSGVSDEDDPLNSEATVTLVYQFF